MKKELMWCWRCNEDTPRTPKPSGQICDVCGYVYVSKWSFERISQAIAEGMPLRDEVGRYSNKGELTGPEWIMEMYLGRGAREFIALKEEEK